MKNNIRVGVLNDICNGPPGVGDITHWLQRAANKVKASGRLKADVTFEHSYGLGLPAGSAEAVTNAYEELAGRDVRLIVGPAIGDNALLATPLADKFRIPTINWAGAERARSEYMFHHQVGSHEDESLVIARYMKSIGCRRLGVVYDNSPIGTRHLDYLSDEANIIGIGISASEKISPQADNVSEQVDKVLATEPDGFVYLGLGLSAPAVSKRLRQQSWEGPKIMNTAGLRGYDPNFRPHIEGWIYIDMHSDNNRTLSRLLAETGMPRSRALEAAKGHDIGRLVAEGLARAADFSRDGIKDGLEQVKWLPAAEGQEGTLLGFGIQDRGALHGRYLVVRQWLNGESVELKSQPQGN